jgi:4-amino-4-deoxy-L-arabinose transferase-like glycosyltransferase
MITGMFSLFGEKEWVARLLPITFSLLSVVLLWLLVQDCVNARAAAFCVLAFAAMPMELRYGRMVNFEPINLAWLLGGLLGLHFWQKAGRRRWRLLACAALVLSLWTAWQGYMFVLVLCTHFLFCSQRRDLRLALLLLGISVASLLLFLLEVHHVRPGAWRDMFGALNYRMAHSGHPVPWRDWAVRMRDLLMVHIQPAFWVLGLVGTLTIWRSRENAPLRWLGWAASCFFVMNLFYVVAFRNASSIHDYASFYFTLPVAIMAGVGLDAVNRWCERRGGGVLIVGMACSFVVLGALLLAGARQTLDLRRPFSILSSDQPEPPELIPELGRTIRVSFGSEDVAVICNFLPVYGPQLHYYAQHELLACAFTSGEWKELIADPENAPLGGVIWMGDAHAEEVLASLPPGAQQRVTIRNIPFCFWRPKGGGG